MDINIEISKGSSIKYEYEGGKLKVDRFLNVPFVYPFNYGYIPNTLGRDKDPLDAVIVCEPSLIPGSSIKCKLIGVLLTEDESGEDNKFIFVPDNKVDKKSINICSLNDIPEKELEKIKYFFTHYKDLDVGKWVKVGDWVDGELKAGRVLKQSCIKWVGVNNYLNSLI
jgi:inorganic pyrophosphatase